MRLYIVRHGKAIETPSPVSEFPRPDGYPTDWDRPLTPRGEAQAGYLGAQLKGIERRLSFILASRYPRALKTARLIAQQINVEVSTRPELEVDHSVSEILRLLDEFRGSRALMIVAHNPQLGELLSVLASGLPPRELVLKTGELVALDVRPSSPIGSARIVQRLRMADEFEIVESSARPPARSRRGVT